MTSAAELASMSDQLKKMQNAIDVATAFNVSCTSAAGINFARRSAISSSTRSRCASASFDRAVTSVVCFAGVL